MCICQLFNQKKKKKTTGNNNSDNNSKKAWFKKKKKAPNIRHTANYRTKKQRQSTAKKKKM